MTKRNYNRIPTQLTENQFDQFIFPYLIIPKKGPKPKITGSVTDTVYQAPKIAIFTLSPHPSLQDITLLICKTGFKPLNLAPKVACICFKSSDNGEPKT